MDGQDIPLREWLGDRFDTLNDRLTGLETLLVGNGHPGALSRLRVHEERLDTMDALLAYDRQQIDTLRTAPKKERRKLGISLSGISAVIAAIVAGLVSGMNQK